VTVPCVFPRAQTGGDFIPRTDVRGIIRIKEAVDLISMVNLALQPAGGSGADALISLRHSDLPGVVTVIPEWVGSSQSSEALSRASLGAHDVVDDDMAVLSLLRFGQKTRQA
jgi:hypothetical protein